MEFLQKQKQKSALKSKITTKLWQILQKDRIHKNSNIVYNMNSKLQFPIQILFQQLKDITEDTKLIKQSFKKIKMINYLENSNKVKLVYEGSQKIVLLIGLNKKYIEEGMRQFFRQYKHINEKLIKVVQKSHEKVQLVTDSYATSELLKKFFRQKKRKSDKKMDYFYKLHEESKIRIIIQSEEFYSLLLDYTFSQSQKQFHSNFVNPRSDFIYQSILNPYQTSSSLYNNSNFHNINQKKQYQEDFDSSQSTSKCSQQSKLYQIQFLQTDNKKQIRKQLKSIISSQQQIEQSSKIKLKKNSQTIQTIYINKI